MMIKKLKQYMKDNNINQKQLASLMNITEAHLSRLLNFDREPGKKTFEAYYNLPGVKEKEAINNIRARITELWTNETLYEPIAKDLLKILNPQE